MRLHASKLTREACESIKQQATYAVDSRTQRFVFPILRQHTWRTLLVFFAVTLLAVASIALYKPPQTAYATSGINQELSFEGKVMSSSGQNIADGSYNMEFKIYTGCTSNTGTGCTAVWTEDWLVGSSPVTFTSGTFHVNLGSITPFGSSVPWNTYPLYLSMQIGNQTACTPAGNFQTNCGGDGVMSPYILLTSTPYAFNSNELGGLTASQFGQLAANQTWTGTNTFQSTINSTTALLVQDTNANPVLSVDTTDNAVNIGSTTQVQPAELYVKNTNSANRTAIFQAATGQTADILDIFNSSGAFVSGYDSSGNLYLDGSVQTGDSTSAGTVKIADGSGHTTWLDAAANSTNNPTITLPNASGTLCLDTQNCSIAGSGYILNQSTSPGTAQTGNFNISGTGIVSTELFTPLVDATTPGGTLIIGSGHTQTGSVVIGYAMKTGNITLGGSATTGTIVVGKSTGSNAVDIGNGATASGSTQTVNIATSGLSGATTDVTVGSTASGGGVTLQAEGISNTLTGSATAPSDIIKTSTNSTAAFRVQNSTAATLFTVDTTDSTVTIGAGTAGDTTPILLTLDNGNSSTDPTGIPGAMYYNAALGRFRCYENGSWKNCIGIDPGNQRHTAFYSDDFFTATSAWPWSEGAINSGTIANGTGSPEHPGVYNLSSSANSGSGFKLYTAANSYFLSGGDATEMVFNPAVLTNTTTTFGFTNGTYPGNITSGVYIDINGATVSGVAESGSVSARTGTTYTLTAGTWYRARLVVNSALSQVDFYLYDGNSSSTTPLWHDTVTTDIPPSTTGLSHAVMTTNSGTTAQVLLNLDYMAMWHEGAGLTR